MKWWLVGLMLVWGLATVVASPAKAEHIRELLALTDAKSNAIKRVQVMIQELKKQITNVPESLWDTFFVELDRDLPYEEMYLAAYPKFYSDEEIVQLIEFHRTPLGQKLIANNVALAAEMAGPMAAWSQKFFGRVLDSLKKAGVSFPQPKT